MNLNKKGYMLIEIILAMTIVFCVLFFITELVIKLKNKNDDLFAETIVKTDTTIINNRLFEYAKNETEEFDCSKLTIEKNVLKYGDDVIDKVSEYADIGQISCINDLGKISITIPLSVMQMPDKKYDISFDYKYESAIICPDDSIPIEVNNKEIGRYTGTFEIINETENDWKIKFLTSGTFCIRRSLKTNIDIFVVGGGGGGSSGGGGGGYTKTYYNQIVFKGIYDVVVGNGGATSKKGETSYFIDQNIYFANGGDGSTYGSGGNGGSGGGAHGCKYCTIWDPGSIDWCAGVGKLSDTKGGKYGNNAASPPSVLCFYDGSGTGGNGQGYTTCEFEEGTLSGCNDGVTAYSQGGIGTNALANSGNGGNVGNSGSSGIVIIRNAR